MKCNNRFHKGYEEQECDQCKMNYNYWIDKLNSNKMKLFEFVRDNKELLNSYDANIKY